ncbi:MAG: hypothetical protein AAF171_25690 [Cyanobacteria bacterium P01_A01_bin.116]
MMANSPNNSKQTTQPQQMPDAGAYQGEAWHMERKERGKKKGKKKERIKQRNIS